MELGEQRWSVLSSAALGVIAGRGRITVSVLRRNSKMEGWIFFSLEGSEYSSICAVSVARSTIRRLFSIIVVYTHLLHRAQCSIQKNIVFSCPMPRILNCGVKEYS